MRILFIHYGTFDCNSAIQTFHFANRLTDLGFEVAVCGLGDVDRVHRVGEPRFECLGYGELLVKVAEYRSRPAEMAVHAWTPRERVRVVTADVVRHLGVPYVVHLEDNEDHLVETLEGRGMDEIRDAPVHEQSAMVGLGYAHPTLYPEFLRGAAGITMITEELNEFNFGARPHHVMRPGVDTDRFSPDLEPAATREQLGIGADEFVLVYHGVTHHVNEREMFSLYLAINLLRRRGRPVRLVRLGQSVSTGLDPSYGALRDRGAVELGAVPWREIPGYLAIADAFVQPGAPDDFNRYRLPSKLPEFLAMGRPVVLPRCNIGADLEDRVNALLLEEGTGLEIADRVESLVGDRELATRLGRGAREFALHDLDWDENTARLAEFYRRIAHSARNGEGRSMPPADPMRRSSSPGIQRLREVVRVRTRARAARARIVSVVRETLSERRAGAVWDSLPPGLAADRSRSLVPDEQLWRLTERYRGRFEAAPLSYGTVRDYADSRASVAGLATASFDLKNLQRCWALKAVLGAVNGGGRVVEIGAGEPLVAGLLSRMGYEVIVVDPYDGSGNGPLEYRAFKRAYPELGFVRDRFPPGEPIEGPIAAVYSISVLEHLPPDSIEEVIGSARELVSPAGGCCIHAIDHVVRGWGAEEHRERLDRVVAASGLDGGLLEKTIDGLEQDPETYFVSAEAHDRWRGSLPYDEYPMRRIASINLVDRVEG